MSEAIAAPIGRRERRPFLPPPAPRRAWLVALGLWFLAAVLLVFRLGSHPPFPYNWEAYTGWHVFDVWMAPRPDPARVFALTDGLMTDSGQGPLVGLPVWLGFQAAGVGLLPMRLPVALLAALAVPLLWVAGRRLLPERAALLAALLLAISPAFLFYGRTATLVGVSLVPELLTLLALLGTLAATNRATGWRWVLLLQVALVLGEYAYAPVRLLWPLSLVAVGGALLADHRRWRWRLGALAVTAVVLPVALVLLGWLTASRSPEEAVTGYFRARGEQVLTFGGADLYRYFIRPTPEEAAADGPQGSERDLALRLLAQNGGDLGNLLADRGTAPIRTDYWNERGRLWPGVVGIAFALGAAVAGWRVAARRDPEAALLLLCALGTALPLLLTSQVHVGRLLPALPFLLLLAALGVETAVGALARLAAGTGERGQGVVDAAIRFGLPAAFLAAAALATRAEFAVTIGENRESLTTAALAAANDAASESGVAALVENPDLGAEIELVHAAHYRIMLDGAYRFVDLGHVDGTLPPSDPDRPTLLYGDILGRLQDGTMPRPCRPLYLVVPEVADPLRVALATTDCPRLPTTRLLPP